jgi:hypothetical protein
LFGNVIVDLSVDDSKEDYQTCHIVDGEKFCYNSVFSYGGEVLVTGGSWDLKYKGQGYSSYDLAGDRSLLSQVFYLTIY